MKMKMKMKMEMKMGKGVNCHTFILSLLIVLVVSVLIPFIITSPKPKPRRSHLTHTSFAGVKIHKNPPPSILDNLGVTSWPKYVSLLCFTSDQFLSFFDAKLGCFHFYLFNFPFYW